MSEEHMTKLKFIAYVQLNITHAKNQNNFEWWTKKKN